MKEEDTEDPMSRYWMYCSTIMMPTEMLNLNRIGIMTRSNRVLQTLLPALSLLVSPQQNMTKGIGKVKRPKLKICTKMRIQ